MSEFGELEEISRTNIVAVREDAEKLWNYILAYRNLVNNASPDPIDKCLLKNNVTIGVIPLEEVVSASERL